jgi:amidohydrolase
MIKFVFQPGEEGACGAEAMIKDGALENPRPVRALGLHVWNEKPLGWMGVVPGPFMAGAETIYVRISGKGGHGAVPHLAVDPVLAAAQVITALQSIVARNVSPLQSAVVSITKMRAGEAFNIIPPFVELEGTIRSFEPQVHETVLRRFREVVSGVSAAMGCQAEIRLDTITPAVINDEATAARVLRVARGLFPDSPVETNYQTMGSEDMAAFLQEVPGCFFMLGSANAERGLDAGHHHPRFDFDEAVLPKAVALMAAAAVDLLQG